MPPFPSVAPCCPGGEARVGLAARTGDYYPDGFTKRLAKIHFKCCPPFGGKGGDSIAGTGKMYQTRNQNGRNYSYSRIVIDEKYAAYFQACRSTRVPSNGREGASRNPASMCSSWGSCVCAQPKHRAKIRFVSSTDPELDEALNDLNALCGRLKALRDGKLQPSKPPFQQESNVQEGVEAENSATKPAAREMPRCESSEPSVHSADGPIAAGEMPQRESVEPSLHFADGPIGCVGTEGGGAAAVPAAAYARMPRARNNTGGKSKREELQEKRRAKKGKGLQPAAKARAKDSSDGACAAPLSIARATCMAAPRDTSLEHTLTGTRVLLHR